MGDGGGEELHAGVPGVLLQSLEPEHQQLDAILPQLGSRGGGGGGGEGLLNQVGQQTN